MTSTPLPNPKRLYRVDKFKVPHPARDEFLERVRTTHQVLRTVPGFVEDFVLEQIEGPGTFNFVTVAVWESADAMDAARKIIMTARQEMGFNPAEMFARLGIEADIANYAQVQAKLQEG